MDEKTFFKAWIEICGGDKNKENIINAWDSRSSKKYTNAILGASEKSILSQLGTQLQLEIAREYWKCDAVFYSEEEILKENPFNSDKDQETKSPASFGTYIKQPIVHLEHENNIKTAWQEIFQLAFMPAELNVLVTYPNSKEEGNDILKKISNLIKEIKFNKDTFLLIFGYHEPKSTDVEWCCYCWNKDEGNLTILQ